MKLCDTCIYGDKYEFEKPCVIYSDDCKLYEEKKMDDMTRKRAISELNQIYGMLSSDKQRALDVAINSLKVDEQYDLMYEELDFVQPHKKIPVNLQTEQAEPTDWIPVSERLPEDREWYLGIFKESDTGWINPLPYICDYVGEATKATTKEYWVLRGFTDRDEHIDYYFNLECVAWMPLPEPYKAESEDER